MIDGNGIDRVFGVGPNAVLTVADVTIRGGTASGIFNQGQLIVQRCLITENVAGYGGGIFNTPSSSAIIESSTISNNVAESEGGGIRFDAAGLVINSTITGNRILESCCTDSTGDGGTQGEGGGIDARPGRAARRGGVS
ncbi:MAG: right-handed parallel beta-helix repeat-containing protein, partial [Alloalcanivorax venustensis]